MLRYCWVLWPLVLAAQTVDEAVVIFVKHVRPLLQEKCAACHGPEGQGDPAKLVPQIAGQPAVYLRNQLLLFKADKRSPGDEAVTKMKAALKAIADETLADVAAYYSSLR